MTDSIVRKDLIYFEIENKRMYEIYYNKNLNKAMICLSWNYFSVTPEHRYTYRPEFRYYINEINDPNKIIEWVGTADDLYHMAKNNIDIKLQIEPLNRPDVVYKHIKNLYKAIILMYEYDNKMWFVKEN